MEMTHELLDPENIDDIALNEKLGSDEMLQEMLLTLGQGQQRCVIAKLQGGIENRDTVNKLRRYLMQCGQQSGIDSHGLTHHASFARIDKWKRALRIRTKEARKKAKEEAMKDARTRRFDKIFCNIGPPSRQDSTRIS